MTIKLLQIEESITSMEPGDFQTLCDAVISAKGYEKRISPGRKLGSKKTTKGTPDTSYMKNNLFVLCEYTTQATRLIEKVTDDVNKCLNPQKTGIPLDEISEILVFSSTVDLNTSELRDVIHLTESHGIVLEFYGPSRIADIIYHEYQWLAKDIWGIEIGTLEITDYNGFIKYYDSDAVGPGLSNEFINRKEEEELERLLASKSVIVVTGAAGVGKTKLVLEVANRFALTNDFHFWCVRSCQAITYSDVLRAISGSKKNLMFFDDVNKIGGFANILKLAAEKGVKLIVTARNYFLGDIQDILRTNLDFGYHSRNVDLITIPPLNDSDIEKIASESFGITNPIYLRQIKNIAAGNPRLAVMACDVAITENGLRDIQDASNLYDYYYSAVMRDCFEDEKLLTIAGVAAFLTPFDLENSEMILTLLKPLRIEKEELATYVAKLHDLEIVNLGKKRAVAFVDQSLQTYLVKKVFLDKKFIALSDTLILGYEKRPKTIIRSVQGLLQIFQSSEVHALIKNGVIAAWDFFEQNNSSCFIKFRETFSIFNPEKALISVKHEIDNMDMEEFDVGTLAFDKAMSNLVSDNCLAILDNFGAGEYAEDAMGMILAYYEKRPENGLEVYRAIIESFCFDPDLILYSYKREILLTEKLITFIRENPTANNEILFIEIARHLLKIEITITRPIRGNSFEMFQGFLPSNDDSVKYRKMIWEELSRLYFNKFHQARLDKILLNYGSEYGRYGTDTTHAHFESDLISIADFINKNYSPEKAKDVFIVHHILKDMRRTDIDVPVQMFYEYKKSKYFSVLQALEKPLWIGEESYEDFEEKHDNKIEDYVKTIDEHTLINLIDIYKISESYDIDIWEMSSSILKIINFLKQENEELFLLACKFIRDDGLYLSGSHGLLTRQLIDLLGIDETYIFLSADQIAYKDIWLFEYFANIPVEVINQEILENLYNHFKNIESLEKAPYLCLMELKHYKSLDNKFMENISSILFEKFLDNAFMLRIYFEPIFNQHSFTPNTVLEEYRGAESIITDVYFTLSEGKDSFDYKGAFLRAMLANNTCTIHEALSRLSYGSNGFKKLNDRSLDFIWEEDDYVIYANEIFDWICINRDEFYLLENGLFSRIPKEHESKFDLWVKQAIEVNIEDSSRIKILSETICCLPNQKRLEYISHFLDCGASVESFKSWVLFSYSLSGSPSFVPTLNQRMQFLLDIKELLKGVKKLEHRAYIAERIRQLEKSIEWHQLQDFLEKFS